MDQDILVHIVSVELADAGFFQSDHVAAVTIPASKLRDVDVRVSFVVAINCGPPQPQKRKKLTIICKARWMQGSDFALILIYMSFLMSFALQTLQNIGRSRKLMEGEQAFYFEGDDKNFKETHSGSFAEKISLLKQSLQRIWLSVLGSQSMHLKASSPVTISAAQMFFEKFL